MIEQKENDLKMARIESQIIFDKAKAQIDTQFLTAFEEAELNPLLFSEEYLKFMITDAYTSNATFIIGDQVPDAMI